MGKLGARVAALFGGGARSPEFEDFRGSFFGGAAARCDGLDFPALAALRGRERRLAEAMLADALPETRAIAGLGALASRRARRRLAALFEQESAAALRCGETWSGAALIAAAAALWRIAPHYRYARAAIGRLRGAPCGRERIEAAIALGRMPTDEADRALEEALDDEDALVRHYAARALLELHGVPVNARAAHGMIYRVMASQAERRAAGRRDLAAAIFDLPLRPDAP
jgi:hypothetical protein